MSLPRIKCTDREHFILSRIEGRSVLHLGCADWPFTQHRLGRGELLHQAMQKRARRLVGVDLEEAGVMAMRAAGIPDIVLGNSEQDLYQLTGEKFDVVVAGEILEHVLNAGMFLRSIHTVCHEQTVVIITTPNFAPLKRLPRLLWRNEVVHPDHVCYFSYLTLSRLLQSSGYEALDWATYWWDVGRVSRVVNPILRAVPMVQYYADGFCVACKPIASETMENA